MHAMKRTVFSMMAVVVFWVVVDFAEAQPEKLQPGATQGRPTTPDEMLAPWNPQYYLGEWEIEWSPPETGLVAPGQWTGTETVTHIENRYFRIDVVMENEDGTTINGRGMMFYDWGLNGQSVVRYVAYDAGFELFQHGVVGGDLGGYYSHFWETPKFEYNDHQFAVTGRSYYVSPAAYRVNQRISIDGADAFNFGVIWMTKVTDGAIGGY